MIRWLLLCSAAACFAGLGALAADAFNDSASSATVTIEGQDVTIQGEDGTDGTDGSDGSDGADGRTITGPEGPPGESIVGPPGPPGKSIRGPRGRPGKTIRGPKGDKGDTGATGAPGGTTCPPGFAFQTLTLNAPGGQVTMFVCIAG